MATPAARPAAPSDPREIGPADAHRRVLAGEAVLLDVREPEEQAAARVPGAVPLPLDRLLTGSATPPAGLLLTFCRSGNRSRVAADHLAARGLPALNVTGGLRAWAAAGLPVHDTTRGHGGPGRAAI
ncbi:hypothetical protein GCM10010441_35690 [Kitasatospora paracochleata]|uniref:Rhodanese-related sulfurtransferase n=1 Tax=Kitasatospora paracochleata TaxID=58354 RepID=A0ABT1J3R0_9ACTN|nr:rhodanese-like domain-containing protein [Kitasatospora paracochleata]MCP2312080.1 rhodanese-related sulfurtransferase [Kitasatospora paracochleata]